MSMQAHWKGSIHVAWLLFVPFWVLNGSFFNHTSLTPLHIKEVFITLYLTEVNMNMTMQHQWRCFQFCSALFYRNLYRYILVHFTNFPVRVDVAGGAGRTTLFYESEYEAWWPLQTPRKVQPNSEEVSSASGNTSVGVQSLTESS